MTNAPFPLLLAVDTSTRSIGLALYDGAKVLAEASWMSQDHHTVELAPAIAEMLQKAGVVVGDLEAVAAAIGPGSFTGLRIGLALMKGLALARRIPIVGVPSLDVTAAAQPVRDLPLVAILRAGRGRLAVGWYQAAGEAWQSLNRMEVLTAAELVDRIQEPTLVSGELSDEERRLLGRKRKIVLLASPAQSLRRPSFLAEIAWRRWQAGNMDDPASLAPIYLHYNETIPG